MTVLVNRPSVKPRQAGLGFWQAAEKPSNLRIADGSRRVVLVRDEGHRDPYSRSQFCRPGLGILRSMHAEGVKVGLRPSQLGLMHDAHKVLNCEECDAQYQLYYDSDAEGSFTYWSVLAKEIITARHPHHTDSVSLDRVEKF